jgi:protein import protein ZIM17
MNSSRNVLRFLARRGVSPNRWTPRSELRPTFTRLYHLPRTAIPRIPQLSTLSQRSILSKPRYGSTATPPKVQSPPASTETTPATKPESRLERDQVPAYDMTFTCKKCDTRSTHRVSKQGYFHGTVLITCPGCRNRHLIADHLKVRRLLLAPLILLCFLFTRELVLTSIRFSMIDP